MAWTGRNDADQALEGCSRNSPPLYYLLRAMQDNPSLLASVNTLMPTSAQAEAGDGGLPLAVAPPRTRGTIRTREPSCRPQSFPTTQGT